MHTHQPDIYFLLISINEQVFRNFFVYRTAVSGKSPTIKIVHSLLSGIGCNFRNLCNGHFIDRKSQSTSSSRFLSKWKKLCLTGDQEHRNLKLSQLIKCTSPSLHYLYLENSLKNPGGLAHFKQVAKRVPIYSNNSKAGYKCHIHILDLYFSKLPPDAWKKDYFYVTSLVTLISLGSHLYQWEKICWLPC